MGKSLKIVLTQEEGPQTVNQKLRVSLQSLRQWALALFLKVYPFGNSLSEGLTFCYQMLYLVDRSPYYSPMLHLLQQHIVRVSGQEMVHSPASLLFNDFLIDIITSTSSFAAASKPIRPATKFGKNSRPYVEVLHQAKANDCK